MSRVIYANTPATVAQETLRQSHGVRPVAAAEEGCGVNVLPEAVYGFTYSPGLPNAPLFAVRRYRSYETHKLAGGEVLLIGFSTEEAARQIASGTSDMTIVVHPEPDDSAATLVVVPYARMRQHRQYAAPNQGGFTVTVSGV